MRTYENRIESQLISHYLGSGDYNGLPLSRLSLATLGVEPQSLLEVVVPLVKAGRISLPSPFQTNPHVKMFESSIDEQLCGSETRKRMQYASIPPLSL